MRTQIRKDMENYCSICHASGDWLVNVEVCGIKGIYCLKCDTLTISEEFKSKYVYNAFKNECDLLKATYLSKKY